MLASVRSATLLGIDGQVVDVEVHVSAGMPGYSLVGLPDAAGRESRERVRAAMLSSECEWPLKRITVNLAPGAVRKSGSGLELAIALGLLVATDLLPDAALDGTAVIGELSLDGGARPVPGTLALVDALHRDGATRVVVPLANAREAAFVSGVEVLPARNLAELRACLKDELPWPVPPAPSVPAAPAGPGPEAEHGVDLAEVRGLPLARQALAATAAGGHHLLLVGPPGAGKTMLARRLPTILPPLRPPEALEVTRIHSVAGLAPAGGLITARPLRAPHHTASTAALVGGGSQGRLRPGEVTLAHRGCLFLDEIAEFAPAALEALRQPLEERVVHISRHAMAVDFPADFVLIACCNPCPCGLPQRDCRCGEVQRARYRRRLSAPLLDRFDLRLQVGAPAVGDGPGPASATVREGVLGAVARQKARYSGRAWARNSDVPAAALDRFLPLRAAPAVLFREICERDRLSGRGATRVRRVARTFADLDDRPDIEEEHLELAALLREEVV